MTQFVREQVFQVWLIAGVLLDGFAVENNQFSVAAGESLDLLAGFGEAQVTQLNRNPMQYNLGINRQAGKNRLGYDAQGI
jgi:hypothetical protein